MMTVMNRTLPIMFIAQMFGQTGVPVVIFLGGLVGSQLAPEPGLVTLPVAFGIVGVACTTIPAALFMSRFGRKKGFLLGSFYASGACLLAAFAISIGNFWLFCFAAFLIGSNNAFVQQYRFAVAESVSTDRVSTALSILMLAGVVAAWIGPETANQLHDWQESKPYAGSFIGLAGLAACSFLALLFYKGRRLEVEERDIQQRPLAVIIRQPVLLLAVASAAVGFGVMSLIMTATPVSMHVHDQLSLEDTTWVIQSHIMAMYLPSLFSGFLITRFGARKIIVLGLVMMAISLTVGWLDQQLLHYWWALVLLGIAWNFLFIGGTTLVTTTYYRSESFKVQAFNDFIVFSMQAGGALGSGYILNLLGWHWILSLSIPLLLMLLPLLWLARSPQSLQPAS